MVDDDISFWAFIGHKHKEQEIPLSDGGELLSIEMMRWVFVNRPNHTNPIVAGVHSCSKWKWFVSPRALLSLGQIHQQQQQQWLVLLQYRPGPYHHPRNSLSWSWAPQVSDRALLDGAQVSNRVEASIDCFKGSGEERGTLLLTTFIRRV